MSAIGKRMGVLALFCGAVQAQWLDFAEPGVPRGKDGKVKLSAPAPRVGGKPDLSGVWMHDPTPAEELRRIYRGTPAENELEVLVPGMNIELQNKYGFNLLIDQERDTYKPGQPPPSLRKPEGLALLQRIVADLMRRQVGPCEPGTVMGWPQAGLLSEPIKIVQAPRQTVILYELGHLYRQVHVDGRKLPASFDLPGMLGYSVGHWEGDVFVVETKGFRETLLDVAGHARSEAMKITERFHRRDFGHLDVEMTFDDPVAYEKPFSIRVSHHLLPDTDVFEMFCENERDVPHTKPPSAADIGLEIPGSQR